MRDQSGETSLVEYAAGTRTRACREVNEDAFGVFQESNVFIVVDGYCPLFSDKSAANLIVAKFANLQRRDPNFARDVGLAEADPLGLAVLRANAEILQEAQTKPERSGQGAALCAVRASARVMSIVHVGDCRIGRYREGRLIWLTEDHSLVAELRKSGAPPEEIARAGEIYSNVITRALGVAAHLAVDLSYHPAVPGDTYLLCTDGLTQQVDHARISDLVAATARSLRERCSALLDASDAAGGHDDTTVLLLQLRS